MPSLLIISGLDPSGGAGFIADIRIAERFGVRPVGSITATTEQDTRGLRAVNAISPESLRAELITLLSDIEVDAVKLGMIASAEHAAAIREALALSAAPVVWDPVLAPSSGSVPLYRGDPGAVLRALLPHVTLITPNLAEAEAFVGSTVDSVEAMKAAAAALVELGFDAALVKGGHLEGEVVDVLQAGDELELFTGPRIESGGSVHGTGCALSTAIASELAKSTPLGTAIRSARSFVRDRIASPVTVGRGHPSVV